MRQRTAPQELSEGHNCCPGCGTAIMRLSPRAGGGWDMNCDHCGMTMIPVLEVLLSAVRPQ